MASITHASACGIITLAPARAVFGALNERAYRSHEWGRACTRTVAITCSVTNTMARAVLVTQAFVTLLAGPALLTNAFKVVASTVLTTLAPQFAAIFSFVLLLAFARAVEALAVLRAVVRTHELAAVVLPVFRSASAEALVTFAVVRAVILAQSDFAKIAGKQRVTLASAVVAVAVAMAVLLAYLLLAGIAGKARQAGAVAFLVLGLGHLRNSESTLVAALRRVHFILTAVAVEALIALALVLTNTFTMVRTVGGARNK